MSDIVSRCDIRFFARPPASLFIGANFYSKLVRVIADVLWTRALCGIHFDF